MSSSAKRNVILDARDVCKYTHPIVIHNRRESPRRIVGECADPSELGYSMIANYSHPALAEPALSASLLSKELLPLPELQAWVGGAYEAAGAEFMGYFVNLWGLQPFEGVLDVGCGSGRLAVPLTRYLNNDGRYEGFDLSEAAIKLRSKPLCASRAEDP